MEVIVKILSADFKKQANWFIQIELEEQSYPSKSKTKQKQRTDVFYGFSSQFLKNYFSFSATFANKISIRFGAVEISEYSERQKIDPAKCNCIGVYTLVITKRLLAALRDQVSLRETYKLVNPTNKEETCALQVSLSLNFYGIEEQVIEDDRKFMKVEFDRYEADQDVIRDKTSAIEQMLEEKSLELANWMKKVNDMQNAIRSLGADVAVLKKEKDRLETENGEIVKRIERLSKVDDFHIKFDMLITSPQGADLLRLMLEKTDNRLKVQRKVYAELSDNWLKIEGKKRKLDELKAEVEKVKEAQSQLQFHVLTLQDQLPTALTLRDNVKSLDGLIKDFERQIAKGRTVKRDKATEVEVVNLKHQLGILREKQKQVQIILDTNSGYLPIEEIEKLNMDRYEENSENQELKKRGEELLTEVERLGQELARQNCRPKTSNKSTVELQVKLQAAEARVEAMQDKMNEHAALHAEEVAKYKSILAQMDARIFNTREF